MLWGAFDVPWRDDSLESTFGVKCAQRESPLSPGGRTGAALEGELGGGVLKKHGDCVFQPPREQHVAEAWGEGHLETGQDRPHQEAAPFPAGGSHQDMRTGRWQQGGRQGQAYSEEAEEGAGVT